MVIQQFAAPEHIPQLKEIWMLAFPEDGPEAADIFFRTLFRSDECLIHVENGAPVSMVFMLPVTLCLGTGRYPVQYIFAAATHPAWRGKGIFSSLLRRTHEIAKERGQIASCLRPGEPGLVRYYARFEYQPWFVRRLYAVKDISFTNVPVLRDCPPERYAAVRDACLDREAAWIRWEGRFAAYAAENAIADGGCILEGEKGCALCDCDKETGTVIVRELLCPPEEEAGYCAAIQRRLGIEKLLVSRPSRPGEEKNVFGLWCPLAQEGKRLYNQIKDPYLGLALD